MRERKIIMATLDDLKEAFAGESQANRKYTAFSRKADADGLSNVARLFRAAAEAETIHALKHFDAMQGVGTTADNLKAAVDGETAEYRDMYPGMVERAKESGNQMALKGFEFAMKAEEVHARLYSLALEAVKAGKDLDASEIYLCPFCGNVEFGKPSALCSICGAPAERFVRVE
jgi:rubrerythrin